MQQRCAPQLLSRFIISGQACRPPSLTLEDPTASSIDDDQVKLLADATPTPALLFTDYNRYFINKKKGTLPFASHSF